MLAEPVPSYAHRRTDIDITSSKPLIDLQSCVTRMLMRAGRITPVPIEHGVALDFQLGNLVGGAGPQVETYEIRDMDGVRHITIVYRHPVTAKGAVKDLRKTAERCFPESLSQFPSK
jgi:hypothetical protein